jgi:predicted RNA-binding protein with PIN domain
MYLIDGNNVIGQRGQGYETWYKDKPAARRQLLNDLAQLARVKKTQLSVVFDGAPEPHFPDGSSFRGVKVFYARAGSDADTRIVDLVERERNRKALVVVTSDRALAARVRVCGVRVLRSGEFRTWLDEARQIPHQPNDATVQNQEMSEWLRYFGVPDEDNSNEDDSDEDEF